MTMSLNRRQFFQSTAVGAALALGSAAAARAAALDPTAGRRRLPDTREAAAGRFLNQATFGADEALILQVANQGIESWLDQQLAMPSGRLMPITWQMARDFGYREDGEFFIGPGWLGWSWWQQVLTGRDLVRQRVAFALSEIFVISQRNDNLEDAAIGVIQYYDKLIDGALGNFRDLLRNVTLDPCMGLYLSHMGNRKADPVTMRFPDENYAREVMQLFTIGLFELNPDGSRVKDANGNDIPTYDNDTIANFARVFTGLHSSKLALKDGEFVFYEGDGTATPITPVDVDTFFLSEPMVMFEEVHDREEKRLLNGAVLPAGQTGMQDIEDALDNLFNHPNVGPFIGRQLIQRLVKSNPTPSYIRRVAEAFDDNGSGERGDMAAVVRAILLDTEARDASWMNDPQHGMLREPFVRYVQMARALNAHSDSGYYLARSEPIATALGQYPLQSPSVFNFFSPNHRPAGTLAQADLYGPEFQILNSYTALQGYNLWMLSLWENSFLPLTLPEYPVVDEGREEDDEEDFDEIVNLEDDEDRDEDDEDRDEDEDEDGEEEDELENAPFARPVRLDTALLDARAHDVVELVEYLDGLFTYRSQSPQTRARLVATLRAIPVEFRVTFALELIATSPEYAVMV
ncbi:MAG: DUF1800 family protein [Candidatus Competibacterales bacterium]